MITVDQRPRLIEAEAAIRIAIVGEGRIAGVLPAASPAEEFGLLMMG